MAVRTPNRSNTSSSVASVDRTICSGSFFLDVSREDEIKECREVYLQGVLKDRLPYDDYVRFIRKTWTAFFRFMPEDTGGIMSHINTLMEHEHLELLDRWKTVHELTYQLDQLVENVQRFRDLCKDFQIQDREYDCLTSNFLVEKPRGLRMNQHPFFMTSRMMRKLRVSDVSGGTHSVIELTDKYELLENFLLHGGGHFDDTFKLGSIVVQVKSSKNPPMFLGKVVNIMVKSEILGSSQRIVSYRPDPDPNLLLDDIKLMGGVLSCLKHMSNYKDEELQFGVINNLYKVGCHDFIVAESPTIHKILEMQPPNDGMVLVDLSKLSDIPLIFGNDFRDMNTKY